MLRRVGYGRVAAVDRLSTIGRYDLAIAFDECRECTQPVVDSQLDYGTLDHEMRPGASSLTPWGRLTPTYTLSSNFATHEFVPRSSSTCQVSEKEALELDIYTVGRNHKCDVVIDDSRSEKKVTLENFFIDLKTVQNVYKQRIKAKNILICLITSLKFFLC